MNKKVPQAGAVEEAKRHLRVYGYEIDSAFNIKNENIPASFITGAWKVNELTEIVREFIENPNYIDLKKL